jgi:quinol monooxygenase YgiN
VSGVETRTAAMTVVIADMFGIAGRRSELVDALAGAGRSARGEEGCRRYTVSASIADPDHYVVVEEWRSRAALEAHYASPSFERFQSVLYGLLARPSEVTIHSVAETRRPVASGPIDPRSAD